MILSKLQIERNKWGKNKGQFEGKISFDNDDGEISIKLTPDRCQQIFQVCADGLIDTAKEAATELTCQVIEHKNSLEHD